MRGSLGRRSWCGFLAVASTLFLIAPSGKAAAFDRLKQDPRKAFKAILLSAAKGDLGAIPADLEPVSGLTGAIKTELGVDVGGELRGAASGQDKAATLKAAYRLVYLDVKYAFKECLSAKNLTGRKRWVRAAYGDFSLLGATLKKSHFEEHRRLQKAFWKANSCLSDDDRQALTEVIRQIESDLSGALGIEP